jgi:hypothetical protein
MKKRVFGLVSANLLVWTLLLVASLGKLELLARSGIPVELRTNPSAVKVLIDGLPINKDQYVQTPAKIYLNAGEHKLAIKRLGYVSYITTVVVQSGVALALEEIVLEPKNSDRHGKVHIEALGFDDATVNADVNSGFWIGSLPLTIDDLQVDIPHHLTFSSSESQLKRTVSCSFVLTEANIKEPLKLKLIKVNPSKLKLVNCSKKP